MRFFRIYFSNFIFYLLIENTEPTSTTTVECVATKSFDVSIFVIVGERIFYEKSKIEARAHNVHGYRVQRKVENNGE